MKQHISEYLEYDVIIEYLGRNTHVIADLIIKNHITN